MASNAPSKVRRKAVAVRKRRVAVILQRTGAATKDGALTEKTARETYRATVRVRTPRTADPGS